MYFPESFFFVTVFHIHCSEFMCHFPEFLSGVQIFSAYFPEFPHFFNFPVHFQFPHVSFLFFSLNFAFIYLSPLHFLPWQKHSK